MRTIIGVIASPLSEGRNQSDRNAVTNSYLNAVSAGGGIPVILPVTADKEQMEGSMNLCDGILFCGGGDINPLLYHQNPHPLLGSCNMEYDCFQIMIMKKALERRMPLLAICRGIQLLNVVQGGTLYQDVTLQPKEAMLHMQKEEDRSRPSHKVFVTEGTRLRDILDGEVLTNSYHHQSVKDLGEGLVISAKTEDDTIEAIEMADHPFQIGVQWHPECMVKSSESMRRLFCEFVKVSGEYAGLFRKIAQ
ncbi:MAG: gamma-glutamyl-gamma-aminobutyrate hydrolase family protein [Lachnospiraceae bacterium]|nr:gamma-glutamyl-gamma-aminobutyrate hydrolase family protein [Lachnospiraceae bacterium]